jgi:hypothetical protein
VDAVNDEEEEEGNKYLRDMVVVEEEEERNLSCWLRRFTVFGPGGIGRLRRK